MSLFSFFNNKDKIMTTIFIFTHFGLNICHTFLYFVTLKGFVFIKGKLVWLWCSNSLQNRKTKDKESWLCPRNAISPLPLRRPVHATDWESQEYTGKAGTITFDASRSIWVRIRLLVNFFSLFLFKFQIIPEKHLFFIKHIWVKICCTSSDDDS